ncbi:MAG: D-alanyl-D-alanine carboxypeptidase family protein [Clostridia bacterium]|nr:D-alanyl-D-alanine carboxypeptidase family protein [Clostridia bacterium]
MKKIKRMKVNRSYDGIDREEPTGGLLALRIFVIAVMILFIAGTAALFAYNFQKETENPAPSSVKQNESGGDGRYYQIYDTDVEDELLAYCNELYPISENVEPRLADYIDENNNRTIRVNALMKDSLNKMVEDAASDGIRLDIVRGYMTHRECEVEFKSICLNLEEGGASPAEAENRASALFPPAKENEYRTGMLIKISSLSSDDFEATQTYKWLYKNGVNYGFVNRYITDKEKITGVTGDLTVYRFVGTENAVKMRSFGMCLEEYAEYCRSRG